jgi:hypothetical protein
MPRPRSIPVVGPASDRRGRTIDGRCDGPRLLQATIAALDDEAECGRRLEQLEARERLRVEWAAMVAHELRGVRMGEPQAA